MTNHSAAFRLILIVIIAFTVHSTVTAQADSTPNKRTLINGEMHYNIGNGTTLIYPKPKKWGFVTDLPSDAAGIVKSSFSKASIKPWLWIAGSTALLIWADPYVAEGVRTMSEDLGLSPEEKNYNLLKFKTGDKEVALFRLPANLNTAFYQLGQGFPPLVIGAGLYLYGKKHDDYRALSTASQLAESFVLMGVSTQIVKRITGRESPSEATTAGGKWRFFPSFSDYQKNTPNFDAFPSGHLATLVSSITIFGDNYPEKRWIKPLGYSLSALVCYSMINNEVHWISDYPLAIAMGYICAKQVLKHSRRVETAQTRHKKTGEFNFTCNYANRMVQPGFIYKF